MAMIKVTGSLFSRFNAYVAQRERLCLGVLVLSALVVRLITMLYLRTYQFPSDWEMGYEMGRLAQSLASGSGFRLVRPPFHESDLTPQPSAWMPPLYPFIFSFIFRIFGIYTVSSAVVVLLMQSIISSLTLVPLYFVGKRLFGQEVGIISSLLWTFHPGAINYAVRRIWGSSFTALGLVLIVLLFFRLRDRPPCALDSFLCGLTIALTALTNPVVFAFVPFALLWLFWNSGKDRKKAIGQVSVITITMIVALIPWTVRNYIVFHQFVLIKGTSGLNLWQGNNPYIAEGWRTAAYPEQRVPDEERVAYLSSLNEVEYSNVLQKEAVDFIADNPDKFFGHTLRRIYLFWTIGFREKDGAGGQTVLLVSSVIFWGLKILTVLGIVLSWKRWRETSLLLFLFAAFPVPYYITITDTYRYRFPIEGLVLVFVAYSISYLPRLGKLGIGRGMSKLTM